MKQAASTYSISSSVVLNYVFFILAFTVMLARGFLYMGHMPLVHLLCLAGKIALIPIALILTLRTPGKPSAIDLGMILYGAAMYASCLFTHTQMLTITLILLDVFIFWALCRWFIVRQSLFPLKATTLILSAFILINFLLVLWHPAGLWHYETSGKMYFLLGGNYNNMGKAMLIAILSNSLLLELMPERSGSKRMFYMAVLGLTVLMSFATLVFMGSMTSIVGVLLLLGLFALILLRARRIRVTAMMLLVVIYFGLQTWAVFRDMNTPSPRMEYIVQDVLKKDMTFSFRTHIWEQTKLLIEREPLLGYGEHDDQWYQTELDGLTTHNLVLHILLKGGWVAMSCFILLVIATHIQVLRYRLRTTSYAPYMLMAGLWVYLFMMIFEVYPFYSLSIIFIYASLFSRSWNVPADHILNLSK